jgi:hypothetical protein
MCAVPLHELDRTNVLIHVGVPQGRSRMQSVHHYHPLVVSVSKENTRAVRVHLHAAAV